VREFVLDITKAEKGNSGSSSSKHRIKQNCMLHVSRNSSKGNEERRRNKIEKEERTDTSSHGDRRSSPSKSIK
jgi:hypothetical protein